MTELPVYTIEDAKKHVRRDSLWLVIHNKVYDVTSWANDHPGGPDILKNNSGRDCTDDFENALHTEGAKQRLQTMLIGILHEKDRKLHEVKAPPRTTASQLKHRQNNRGGLSLSTIGAILLFIMFLIAYGYSSSM